MEKNNPSYLNSKHYEQISLLLNFEKFCGILDKYDEKHRFYHNWNHIERMIDSAKKEGRLTNELLLAILFHDVIYNPKKFNNESESAQLFLSYFDGEPFANEVFDAILATKTHNPINNLSKQLIKLDLEILYSDFKSFKEYDYGIFKEYQHLPFDIYKEKRIEVLKKYKVSPHFIEYVESWEPNVGVYVGSFNPFHKGHLDILEKAEKIFDKVIIARGINTHKPNVAMAEFPDVISNREIVKYTTLTFKFLKSFQNVFSKVTLIRGIRNEQDLQFEKTQLRYLEDFYPNIQCAFFICDRNLEHISSSGLSNLKHFFERHSATL